MVTSELYPQRQRRAEAERAVLKHMAVDLARDAAGGLSDRRHGVRIVGGQRDVEDLPIRLDGGE